MLRRTPGFTAVVIAVLALGIGANSAIFSVINAVLLRPLPYGNPDRLFRLEEVSPKVEASGVPPADMLVFRERVHAFEQIALSHWQNLTLSGPEGSENQFGGKVSNDGFAMLRRQPLLGRLFRDEEFRPGAPKVVILSFQLWQQRFQGDRNVLARRLILNGEPHTIIAVMPEDFFYDQRFSYWTPWQITAADAMRTTCTVRLRPGITRRQAESEAAAAFGDIGRDDAAKGWTVRLTPLSQSITQRVREGLLVSLGAVAFVVLIACLNVASLLLARASGRSREFALRAAIGAGRARLLRQVLTEDIILSIGGGLAGVLLG